jgi:hypothetical protein
LINKYIKYNGITSKELGLRLVDDIEIESTEKNIELIEIDGVNGGKIRNKKNLKPIPRAFPFTLYQGVNITLDVKNRPDGTRYLEKRQVTSPKVDVEETTRLMNIWLIESSGEWKDFEYSWDDKYLYKAAFFETFNIKGSLNAKKKCILNFKLHPIKYLKLGLQPIQIRKGQTIVNPELRESKPLIKLTGTGDVKLTINSQIFKLKGVSGHIVIDCETQSAYYNNKEPQYDKVYTYPFPVLQLGENTINWDNNSFTCEITPRWEANA